MKITVTYENDMDFDGEVSVVSFSKADIVYLEDALNALGRSLQAAGFTYVDSLEAKSENNHWIAHI